MVGLDGLHGMVAINGWKEVTEISVKSLASLFEVDGIEGIVFTDIGKDGMMGGINLQSTKELADGISVPVIASGGVNDIKDVEALLELEARVDGGIVGVITGRAIYEGTLDLAEAIALTRAKRES
jgi:phosphoribosylformimino-5-aminoimidazole carboxamide ribotide isomerase